MFYDQPTNNLDSLTHCISSEQNDKRITTFVPFQNKQISEKINKLFNENILKMAFQNSCKF